MGVEPLGKPIGIKPRCYWEHFGNLMRAPWEHDGNTLGTKGEKNKKPSSPLQKERNWTVRECMLSLPIGCMKFLFPKLFVATIYIKNLHFLLHSNEKC
jgi:hypothetical protein